MLLPAFVPAQYSYTAAGSVYSQDFNGLPAAGSFTLTGKGPFAFNAAPVIATGMQGWQFYQYGGTGANAVFAVGTGSGTGQGVYSAGAAGSADRALGSLASGTGISTFGMIFTNNTGVTLHSFTIGYTAQQWRIGGSGNINNWTFRYKTGAGITDLNATGLLTTAALNFSSVNTTGPTGALNGAVTANQSPHSYTITGIAWNNGEQLLLRWDDADESGSDDLMAMDNFSFSARPSTWLYQWNGGVSGLYTDPANWTPPRTAVTSSDILLINNAGAAQLNGIPSETIAACIVSGGAAVSLQGISGSTLSVGSNCYVGPGSSLAVNAGTSLLIAPNAVLNVNGSCTSNDGVVLASADSGTASLGTSTGSITGNLSVWRWLSPKRAFRLLSHPFKNAVALDALTDSIDITGTGGSQNGFTNTGTQNPSAFWYDPVSGSALQSPDPGWTAFTSAHGGGNNAWQPFQGIRVLVRGRKTEGLDGNPYTPSAPVIAIAGAPNTGNQVITLAKGAASDYNLVGNPYASPVDLSLIARGTSIGSSFWVWDLSQGLRGGYTSNPFSSSWILPPGAAFFVRCSGTAGNTLSFTESCKVNAPAVVTLLGEDKYAGDHVELRLESDSIFWDRLLLFFNDEASDSMDERDAEKIWNPEVNFFSRSAGGERLSIDTRPLTPGTTVPLAIRCDQDRHFTLKATGLQLPTAMAMWLHDRKKDSWQSLVKGMSYDFDMAAGDTMPLHERFELTSLSHAGNADASTFKSFGIRAGPVPCTQLLHVAYWGVMNGKLDGRVVDPLGRTCLNIHRPAEHEGGFELPVLLLQAGIYWLQLTDGVSTVTRIIMKL